MNDAISPVVYVVDDDRGMLDSTQWLLESVGLEVAAFTDGRRFLEAVDLNQPGCVILDVRMPGLGGLNVLDELRQRDAQFPVIFVSGHADVPIVVRAFKAGALDFIEKPFNEQLLLDAVQQALETSRHKYGDQREQAAARARLATLTPREQDVFKPLAQGYTSREIAARLNVSVKTIDLYRARVMRRLGAERLPDVVAIAIVAGVVDPLALRSGTAGGAGSKIEDERH